MTAAVTVADVANATPAPDETLWERRMRALTLRNAGATYNKIAEQLGVTVPTARKDVRLALREVINETAEDMLARQRSILLDITRANYPAALQGDLGAQSQIIKVLEHEAKLFGLYAPTRVAVGVSDTEFAEQAAELISALGLEPPRELIRARITHEGTEVLDGELVDDADAGAGAGADDAVADVEEVADVADADPPRRAWSNL